MAPHVELQEAYQAKTIIIHHWPQLAIALDERLVSNLLPEQVLNSSKSEECSPLFEWP